MSLTSALQVGRSALATSQAGLQVAGNNMANAGTVGFHRRTMHLAAARDEMIGRGTFIGQGVQLLEIRREVDTALQARLRDAFSGEAGAQIDQRFLNAIETLQNELSDNDLSTLLSKFFNAFSEVANNPTQHAVRAVAVQEGQAVADRLATLRADYGQVRQEIDRTLASSVTKVNDVLDRIEQLNVQITQTEAGVGEAAALRDQRDSLVDELSTFMDISTVEQPNGALDVFVGSLPIVLNSQSRGVELRTQSVGNQVEVTVRIRDDGSLLNVTSGSIGALLRQRDETVQPSIDAIDQLAGQLIFQVNRLHSQGQGTAGQEIVTGTYGIDDTTAPLGDAAAGLEFPIVNGSFFIHVTHQGTGTRITRRIDVDPATMSANDLINEINTVVAVPNVTAGLTPEDQLTLRADAGYKISFSDDTGGTLAALGLNTFFAGHDAATIEVNQVVADDPNRLAAGLGHVAGSGGNALAIAGLQDVKFAELSGASLREFWQNSANEVSIRTDAANTAVETTTIVRESLAAQAQAISGVSLDEESINLLTFQRQYQAAARFISVIDETMRTLLSIV